MRHLHALIIATGLCVPSLALAAPSSASSEPQRAVAAQVSSTQQAQQATLHDSKEVKQSDRDRYAAKEAKSGDAKDYRGGDTVVIGASAAVAILAVLLLVVLL
jgi:protein-disulfide isomerase